MEPRSDDEKPAGATPRYRWPWFVLAALVLAVILAVLWMRREIERTRWLRDLNAPAKPAATAAPPVRPATPP